MVTNPTSILVMVLGITLSKQRVGNMLSAE